MSAVEFRKCLTEFMILIATFLSFSMCWLQCDLKLFIFDPSKKKMDLPNFIVASWIDVRVENVLRKNAIFSLNCR